MSLIGVFIEFLLILFAIKRIVKNAFLGITLVHHKSRYSKNFICPRRIQEYKNFESQYKHKFPVIV